MSLNNPDAENISGDLGSKLTVQTVIHRVMLEAPDGLGRGRLVSLLELEAFIEKAHTEALKLGISPQSERYKSWVSGRNVHLQDWRLYIDTPSGPKHEH